MTKRRLVLKKQYKIIVSLIGWALYSILIYHVARIMLIFYAIRVEHINDGIINNIKMLIDIL